MTDPVLGVGDLVSVEEAQALLLAVLRERHPAVESESVSLWNASGRVIAEDAVARTAQPPFPASAMDGYAVRFDDCASDGLDVIGECPAGHVPDVEVTAGTAVRLYTGSVVPAGADHVVIQEHVTRTGDRITIDDAQAEPGNIRAAGLDFADGDTVLNAGERIGDLTVSLLAAANLPTIEVARRPTVAIFTNGDELREPGDTLAPGTIVNSNRYALCALIERWGGVPQLLDVAADTPESVTARFAEAHDADLLVAVGGASVGDHDHVEAAFTAHGGRQLFTRVRMKPGKPTWAGVTDGPIVIGLPGNPTSAIVAAHLFLQPMIRAWCGEQRLGTDPAHGIAGADLAAGMWVETFLRAEAQLVDGALTVIPVVNQDSSLLSTFRRANALLRRAVDAEPAPAGSPVEIVWLADTEIGPWPG